MKLEMLISNNTKLLEKILRQPVLKELFAVITVGMNLFLQGFTFTYNAFTNVEEDGVTVEQVSLSGSINFLVMFFGAILLGNLMNKYGRKKAIQFFYVMYFVSGGMILFYNECRFYLFYISRIFSGLGNSSANLVFLYISEVCHKSRRGTFAGSMAAVFTSGFLISYILQYNYNLDTLGLFSATIACVSLLMSCFIPETKYWYMMKNRPDEAEKSSLWFNCSQTQKEVNAELQSIVDEVSDDGGNIFTYLLKWPHFKRFLIAQMLLFSRALCGRTPTATFPDLYYSSFHLKFDTKQLSLTGAIFEFVCSIFASCVIGKLNRRTSLFLGASILILLLCLIMIFNVFVEQMNEFCPWLQVICLFSYASILMTFVSSLINLISVEMISSSNKNRASILSVSMILTSLYMWSNAFVFPIFVKNFGIAFPLTYFLCGNIFILIIVFLFVPETRNKALYECANDKLVTSKISKSLHNM